MERTTLQVGTFEVNCTILFKDGKSWIVDPGQESMRIVEFLQTHALTPTAILLTHAHFDHIGGVTDLQQKYPGIPVYIHPGDEPMFGHTLNQLPPDYPVTPKPANLRDARTLSEILPEVTVIETPGHTPGGVCYHFAADGLLLSGDTLFAGSVGRTDLPGGSMATLMESLKKLTALPDNTTVIPGHGPSTTIAAEKEGNPFL